jgi:hypothetical protein
VLLELWNQRDLHFSKRKTEHGLQSSSVQAGSMEGRSFNEIQKEKSQHRRKPDKSEQH